MKHTRKTVCSLMIVLLLLIALPAAAFGNSAEPPCFVVIVQNPPEDLKLTLKLASGELEDAVELQGEQKAWEGYYRFFYHMTSGITGYSSAVLLATTAGTTLEFPLREEMFSSHYNTLLTLDLNARTLFEGQPPLRVPLLVAARALLTLAIEAAVFALFGYREKKSWLIFLLVNLLTQGALNALLTGPLLSPYWYFGYILGEVLVLATELVLFVCLVREKPKGRAALYTVVANILSLVLGGALISFLPV